MLSLAENNRITALSWFLKSSHEGDTEFACKCSALDVLRNEGFPTVTGFAMERRDLESPEAWYRAFRGWCSANGLRFSEDLFILKYPYNFGNMHDVEPLSAADCIQEGWSILKAGQTNKLTIQKHIPAARAADFDCWVIETESRMFFCECHLQNSRTWIQMQSLCLFRIFASPSINCGYACVCYFIEDLLFYFRWPNRTSSYGNRIPSSRYSPSLVKQQEAPYASQNGFFQDSVYSEGG